MFKNIVIPIDLEEPSSWQTAKPFANDLFKTMDSNIHFVSVIPDFGVNILEEYLPYKWIKNKEKDYKNRMIKLMQELPQESQCQFQVLRGTIYDEVINYAVNIEADIIMIPAIRPAQKEYMLGPNASKIVRHSKVSVFVIRS